MPLRLFHPCDEPPRRRGLEPPAVIVSIRLQAGANRQVLQLVLSQLVLRGHISPVRSRPRLCFVVTSHPQQKKHRQVIVAKIQQCLSRPQSASIIRFNFYRSGSPHTSAAVGLGLILRRHTPAMAAPANRLHHWRCLNLPSDSRAILESRHRHGRRSAWPSHC